MEQPSNLGRKQAKEAAPEYFRELMLAHQRSENAAAARRLLAVKDCVEARLSLLTETGSYPARARYMALSEIAAASTCTIHTAEVHESIGELLANHLPEVRDTALAGFLDYRHLLTIYRRLAEVDPDLITRLDPEIALSARKLAPGPLNKEIERLLLAADPEIAARRHARERGRRHVAIRSRQHGMAGISAYLTADEAVAFDESVDAIAGTVCRRDPRPRDTRRADAMVAMASGEGRIGCRCGRDDCTATPAAGDEAATAAIGPSGAPKRSVHVYLHADLSTIAHLTDKPGYLEGYGEVCADYARMLAENAKWQLILAEAKHMAGHWLTRHPAAQQTPIRPMGSADDTAGGEPEDGEPEDGEPEDGDACGVHVSTEPDPEFDDPEYLAFLEEQFCRQQRENNKICAAISALDQRKYVDDAGPLMGLPRPAAPTPLRHARIPGLVTVPVIGDGKLIDTIEKGIADRPELAAGVYPDGHGGYEDAPQGALRYRPSQKLVRTVKARDGHCRHPGCLVTASRCEIDHVVPFRHDDPASGGWTIPENLHCLCKQHHQLKTWGFWDVAILPGYAEHWSSEATGQRMISLPGGLRPQPIPPPAAEENRTNPVPARREPKAAFAAPDPDEDFGGDPPPF
ncbi:MAG: HNH endonuclease [Tomitella sp.]|nr:HNH endonuclease [Tomitella sp.]